MSYALATEWEVRTTGDDSNGGAFNTASSGTDYSQQDSAQITYTDLVIDASNNLRATSAAHPFTSAHVGNMVNITGGTGFTVQRAQITAILSGSVAQFDRALGTTGSTGGAGKLGGALATVATAVAGVENYNTVHVKAGTYTLTTGIYKNFYGHWKIIGYGSTHRDDGTKPLITTATNSVDLITTRGDTFITFENLSLSNTASTRGKGFTVDAGGNNKIHLRRCILDGFSYGVSDGGGSYEILHVFACEIKNCSTAAINTSSARIFYSYIHNNTSHGIYLTQSDMNSEIYHCVVVDNGGIGIHTKGLDSTGFSIVAHCTIANNGSHGAYQENGVDGILRTGFWNNIVYGNGGYGFKRDQTAAYYEDIFGNAYGSNTSGNRQNVPTATGDVTLTADPFTASGSGDYTLNSVSGGGVLVRAAGSIGALPSGSPDIGSIQTPAGGGINGYAWAF